MKQELHTDRAVSLITNKVNTMTFKITTIQIFNNSSANIAINDSFMIQFGTDNEFSIPKSSEASWNDDVNQDAAYEEIDLLKLVYVLGLSDVESIENLEQFAKENNIAIDRY